MQRTIGILALQGDFDKHRAMFRKLSVSALLVKKTEDLKKCDGLVIPGGESTTLSKLINVFGFYDPIIEFAKKYAVMGTCAGAILAASEADDSRVMPLKLIDISVRRNAYGRQIDSFITDLDASLFNGGHSLRSVFIRAPRISRTGSDVKIMMEYNGEPVMVREKNTLALAFHPELTDDTVIHSYFLSF